MARPKIQNQEFRRLQELSDISGDKNSCSVIAFAAAMNLDYVKAFKLLEEAGRKKGKGAYDWDIQRALRASGFEFHRSMAYPHVKNYKYSKTLTFNNAVKVLDKDKVYLLIGTGHMAAMKYGQVVDWSEGRKIRVDEVVEITIKEK